MSNTTSLSNRIANYLKKIKWIIIFFFIVIVLFYLFNTSNSSYSIKVNTDKINYSDSFSSDEFNLGYLFIFIMFICLILCIIKLIKKQMIIEQDKIKVISRLFGIKIRVKYYINERIDKFIIGLMGYKKINCVYNIYIDQNNNIQKIHTLETYKECMEIMKQIRENCNIKIFDGTNRVYLTEEDLNREYYKMKNMIDEIKAE